MVKRHIEVSREYSISADMLQSTVYRMCLSMFVNVENLDTP